jgi:hypothetical protein
MSQQHGIIMSVEAIEYILKCIYKRYNYASMEIDEESGLIHGRIQKYTDAHLCLRTGNDSETSWKSDAGPFP